jgi:hypothetical protein
MYTLPEGIKKSGPPRKDRRSVSAPMIIVTHEYLTEAMRTKQAQNNIQGVFVHLHDWSVCSPPPEQVHQHLAARNVVPNPVTKFAPLALISLSGQLNKAAAPRSHALKQPPENGQPPHHRDMLQDNATANEIELPVDP